MENKKLPTYCCIALLESCFMQCKMCFKWKNSPDERDPSEPSIEQWKGFISSLSEMCQDNKLRINFAGGEPLLRTETTELIDYANRLGFDTLLATNGYLLDKSIAKQLQDAGLKHITISLDSLSAKKHDYLRGTAGSFDKVRNALLVLGTYAPDIEVDLTMTLSAVNIDEAVDMVVWANKDKRIAGIGFQAITQPFNTQRDDTWYRKPEFDFLWPSDMTIVDAVMDKLVKIKHTGVLRNDFRIENPDAQFATFKNYFHKPDQFIKKDKCHIDQKALNITPSGEIHICFNKLSIGNIKNDSIHQIWDSQNHRKVKESISKCRSNCQALVNCNFDEEKEYVE